MSDEKTITRLVETKGTRRVYEMADGAIETREGGSVSWRNNNPGNLKLEYAGSADKTVTSKRSYEGALKSARDRFEGVVALDQWGNAIFETAEAGRKAQATLVGQRHGEKTIAEMVKHYAKDDYTGKADTEAYARSVYAEGDRQGVDLRGKKIKDLSEKEFGALLDGMKKVEGFQEGTLTRAQPRADAGPEALSPRQQRVHQMATQMLGLQLGATHSPSQIDALARSAVAVAAENAGRGDVQGVFLSKDRQTIALKQAFGLSEFGVQEALNCSLGDPVQKAAPSESPQPVVQAESQTPQMAALSR